MSARAVASDGIQLGQNGDHCRKKEENKGKVDGKGEDTKFFGSKKTQVDKKTKSFEGTKTK